MPDKPKHTYKAPVPPQAGYRRGFEPRPGESDSQRLKRELEELKRRAKGKASGANYDHYNNAKGGKISTAEAVHKHERAKHKGQPLTKLAKGGSASKRGDGCATKGKTKGKFV
jgi:hypothetical protein